LILAGVAAPEAASAAGGLFAPEPETGSSPLQLSSAHRDAADRSMTKSLLQPTRQAGDSGEFSKAAAAAPLDTPPPSSPIAAEYGREGTEWWTVGASIANDVRNNRDYGVYASWTKFLVDNVEFTAQLNVRYFAQSGEDAAGLNPVMLFRWHFFNRGGWTLFTDAGIGLLFTNDTVPDGSTSFNFTPRAGGGFTRQLTDSGTRLIVGLTWAHVSNARILGDHNNQSRDSAQVYAGVIFPF